MEREFWVLAQQRHGDLHDVTLEALGEARDAARHAEARVCALVLHKGDRPDWLTDLAAHGADRVYLIGDPRLEPFTTDIHLPLLANLVREHRPLTLWLGATADGKELAPRLAARLDAPLAAGCVRATAAPRRLSCIRPGPGAGLHATLDLPLAGHPCLVTFTPGFRGLGTPAAGRTAEVVPLPTKLSSEPARVRHLSFVAPDHRTVDIREASRIVGVGRGACTPEGLRLVAELADLLGAAVGGTRVVVDRGALPFSRQIGTTGKSVSPRLYIACGISGAVQHTAGLKGVQDLIAINTDRTAPICALADLAVIGDAEAVLAALIRRLGAPDTPNVGTRSVAVERG